MVEETERGARGRSTPKRAKRLEWNQESLSKGHLFVFVLLVLFAIPGVVAIWLLLEDPYTWQCDICILLVVLAAGAASRSIVRRLGWKV